VRLRATLNSIAPLDRIEVVRNGSVLEKIPLDGERRQAKFDKEVSVTQSGWFTLQAISEKARHPVEDSRPMATTNPIFVYVGEAPIRSAASADYFTRWIDELTKLTKAHPGWRSDWEKEHVLAQYREARAIYERRRDEARQ
jgi:hypothetical protein